VVVWQHTIENASDITLYYPAARTPPWA